MVAEDDTAVQTATLWLYMRKCGVSVSLHLSRTASPTHEWCHAIYCAPLLLDCSLIYQPSISETDDKIASALLYHGAWAVAKNL
jgi:hypothetical protein